MVVCGIDRFKWNKKGAHKHGEALVPRCLSSCATTFFGGKLKSGRPKFGRQDGVCGTRLGD